MAPTRKSRSMNKRFSNGSETSPEKDVGNSNKHWQRKRKLSDMLGPQWSKEELEHFYEAYRKYGKDWKKVAGVVRNRSVEMVEALYNMNRAYLSLPEGTASVAGLIAMMTDHYNVLEGNDSDCDSNDASRSSRKPKKCSGGKGRLSASKDLLHSQSIASSDGCLSLLKRRCSDGCAVGKRTPRFPVSYGIRKDISENYFSPNKRGRKSEIDDDVAHVAALALTEASQRGGSSQICQSPYGTEQKKPSPLRLQERMVKMARTKLRSIWMNEKDFAEGGLGKRGTENGDYARDALMNCEGVGTVEVCPKGNKVYGKKEKVEDVGINQGDDGQEACSGTEGLDASEVKGNVDNEVTNAKIERSSSQGKRKRKKKLFFGDESSGFAALLTLADLSSMMPASTVDAESSVQLKEEKPIHDSVERSSVLEAMSSSHQGDKSKVSGVRERVAFAGVDASTCRKSKLGRDSTVDCSALCEGKEQTQATSKLWKKKRKSSFSKILKFEAHSDSPINESSETGAFVDEDENFVNKRTGQNFVRSKSWQLFGPMECSSSNSDQKKTGTDSVVSTAQVPAPSEVSLPAKHRRRRKMDPKRMWTPQEIKFPDIISRHRSNKLPSSQDKGTLSCCLSSLMLRRWCTFEWFYSAIDYPWFAKQEFVEYLNHVGLGHIPRLTCVEWGVIRSSLGKPRRFSACFLCEEREKLKQYRESVRKHYSELRAGIREGLPTDLARPLSVGRRVIALHPKSREVHDGSVLTVDHDKCRIQFDRPELGVEFVMDIDCMPLNPLDNMPEALRRQFVIDKFSVHCGGPRAGQSNILGSIFFTPSQHLENAESSVNPLVKPAKGEMIDAFSPVRGADVNGQQASYSQTCTAVHIHAREADIRALSELDRALYKKEAILMELKHANDDLLKNQNDGASSLKDVGPFKKQYAMVLLQLKEASDQVSSALHNLRQRNTHLSNSLPPWHKPPAISAALGVPESSLDNSASDHQELGSNVVEVVKNSRVKANTMVDVAIQAMSSTKEGEDAFTRLGEALDSLNKRTTPDSGSMITRCPELVNGGMNYNHQVTSSSEALFMGHASGPTLVHVSDRLEAQMPSELITSCVTTLLMIQMCTERQYPPADVAQILDSAVTSLHPCCPQNLPIYREIQMYMGRIKTQILALVPT